MIRSITRRATLGAGLAAAALTRRARAERPPIRVGAVLTDMAGVYAANTGPRIRWWALQLAVEDFLERSITTFRWTSCRLTCS